MYKIDFNRPVHIHFIGIGGISMSGLVELLLSKNFTVSGSDSKETNITNQLKAQGCRVYIGQSADNVDASIDAVVYTAAIHPDNPEYARCIELGLPMLTRGELLGQVMSNYRTAIGVSGTHGKTTTTSMLSEILMLAGTDPTISVGGMLPSIGGNMRIGHSGVFLTEACEYTNSFLSFHPTMNIILNVEEDHLDFFKDIDDIRLSFKKYTELLPDDGYLIINSAIKDYSYFYRDCCCTVITFGMDANNSNYSAANMRLGDNGDYCYTLLYNNEAQAEVSLKVPGEHNVLNSLAAIAAAVTLGIDVHTAVAGVSAYKGVDRRFQVKGQCMGFTIIDDYAHHPAEITATLRAAAQYPHKKLWCVFQPHTYTRTKAFLPEFAKALSLADHVVLAGIYSAGREQDVYGISSADIAKLITEQGTPCEYFEEFAQIEEFLKNNCKPGDVVLTMGAGNILEVGEHLIKP